MQGIRSAEEGHDLEPEVPGLFLVQGRGVEVYRYIGMLQCMMMLPIGLFTCKLLMVFGV